MNRLGARLLGVASLLLGLAGSIRLVAAQTPTLPRPEVRTLANGLRVAVFREPRLPIVQFQVLVEAGSVADPADAPGAALFAAQLLTHGTSSRNAGQFATDVERIGGNIEAVATRDYATIDGAFLARDLESGLELMSDAVVNPIFEDAEVKTYRSRAGNTLLALRRSPATLADEQIWSALFPGHPYGRPVAGTLASIARMSRDRVQAFYLDHYRPDRATLAIAGDVDPTRAFALAEEWFGRWLTKSRAAEARVPKAPPRKGAMEIRIVDVPDAPVVQLRAGWIAPARGTDDEPAFTLANVLFGGNSSSRLARSPALARYGARSNDAILRESGVFTVALAADPDSAGAVIARLRAEVRRFAAEPPAAADVNAARATALAVFPMRFETLGGLVGYWSGSTFSGLGGEEERWAERMANVTASQLGGVIRRWMDPDRITLVAVGPAARLQSQLESFGDVQVVAADAEPALPKPVETPEAAATPQQVARGRELIARALTAHGGTLRLKRIVDSTVEADATLEIGDQEVHGSITQIRKEPWRMLFTTDFHGVSTRQALTGTRGWTGSQAASETHDMDTLSVAGMRSGFSSDVLHLLLAAGARNASVASRGRQKVGGQEAEAVAVGTGADRRILYFDPGTGRLVAMDQHETAAGAGSFLARRLYRDYRAVQGIQWPFVEERLLDGKRVMLIEARKVALNTGVRDDVFERPGASDRLPAR